MKGHKSYTFIKPEGVSDHIWETLVENFENKLSSLCENEEEQSIYAIKAINNSNDKLYYDKNNNTWVDSVQSATHYNDYQEAFKDWKNLSNSEENKFKKISIPVVNDLLTEDYLDDRNKLDKFNLKDWYTTEYPTDEEGQYLNDKISLKDVYVFLKLYGARGDAEHGDFYDYIGVGDSVVRERIFKKLAEELNVSYEVIYDYWLKKVNESKKTDEELLCEETEEDKYGALAWKLNKLMMAMNNEEAYYTWIYIWPDGTSEEDAKYYFGTKEEYDELLDEAKRLYELFHEDGLYDADAETIELAKEFDKELGLEPIDILD